MNGLYFEDLRVGAKFKGEAFEMTEGAIIAFAREFDVQAFHLEHAAAGESLFQGLAASGWHTAAIVMRLFTTGPMRFAGGAIGLGVDELRWPNAVRAGDIIRLETEVLELRMSRSKPNHGIIRIRNVATNQKDEVVLRYEANAIVPRRPVRTR